MSAKGIVLKGEFKNDELSNNQGVLEYDNGDRYTGQIYKMKRHGKGTLILEKGGSFEGQWREDYISNGTLKLSNGYFY